MNGAPTHCTSTSLRVRDCQRNHRSLCPGESTRIIVGFLVTAKGAGSAIVWAGPICQSSQRADGPGTSARWIIPHILYCDFLKNHSSDCDIC